MKTLKGVVSSGKEARVYWAIDHNGLELAVKIYLTSTAEFRRSLWKYLHGDPRYEWVSSLPSHKLMTIWAKKEFANLKKMYDAGINVPEPLCVHRNVLVMRFLGENGVRAPLLKELHESNNLDQNKATKIFDKLIHFVYLLYWHAKLIHSDLSEYNIMIFNDEPYIIDVSQAIRIDHPNALQFLYRDVKNIVRFFSDEIGIKVSTAEDLMKLIIEKKLG